MPLSISSLKSSSEVFWGVPTYFRAGCWEAQRGGNRGYHEAAWHLSGHLSQLLEPGDEPEVVEDKLDELEQLVRAAVNCQTKQRSEYDEVVLRWFDRELPRCMRLVPCRRRPTFLKGVFRAVEDERVFEI